MKFLRKLTGLFTGSNDDNHNNVVKLKKPLKSKKDADVNTVITTQPVTVRAKKKVVSSVKLETHETLALMPKSVIEELARANFGVELDRRTKKLSMIDRFMEEQKKDNQ